MDRRLGNGARLAAASLALALFIGGCASAPTRVERFRAPLPGSTATTQQTNTGSYGSGTQQVTTTYAQGTWEGKPALLQQTPTGTYVLSPVDGNRMGFLNPAGETVWTLDPPIGYRYPLEPGKAWTVDATMTLRRGAQGDLKVPLQSSWKVHDLEEVTVPAGTFKALRITATDVFNGRVQNEDTYWVEPANQLVVKASLKRPASNAAGEGTRQTELVSHTIRR